MLTNNTEQYKIKNSQLSYKTKFMRIENKVNENTKTDYSARIAKIENSLFR